MTVYCVAVCCSMLLYVAVCCSELQLSIDNVCDMTHKRLAKGAHDSAVCCCVLRYVATCCSVP